MTGETIVITRTVPAAGEDEMGNPLTTTVQIPVEGCAFEPMASADEVTSAGTREVTAGRVYAPGGTVFQPADIVTIRGTAFALDGDAAHWRSRRTGREVGVVVTVKRGS